MANVNQNIAKAKVQQLIETLPKKYGYAQLVVDRLGQKGVLVKPVTVYQVVHGSMHHPDVVEALILIVEEYKRTAKQLHDRIDAVLNQ